MFNIRDICKNSFFVFVFLFSIANVSSSEIDIIEDIDVEGLQRIDVETVISYSDVKIKDIYSDELGNDILRNLFETNLFSNIEISFQNNVLKINVKENPTVNLVIFKGNSKIKDDDLLIEISLKERSVYSRTKVKKDIERMLTLYQRSGRLSTEINPTVEVLDNNRVNLVYEIDESEVSKVSNIIIMGNKVFSSSKIKSIMKTKTKTFFRFLSSSDNYDPDKLEYDKQLITEFYNNNGYADFKFISSIAQLIPNSNSFEIILKIDEGIKYNFGKVTVSTELKKMNKEIIMNSINISENEIFNGKKIKDSIDQIRQIAELQGYSFIEINTKTSKDNENSTIDIELVINEGPRVYVNSINIEGNTRTIDKVIRREFDLSEGDAYNKFAIDYSKDSIKALNFFSSVEINELRTEYSDKLDINILVEEKNTGEATIGAGYSSAADASLQFGLKENNFLGKGQKVNFTTSFSNTRNTYDISLTEPYFNDKQLSLTSRLYSNFYDPNNVNYETEDFGLAFSTLFPIATDRTVEVRYSLFNSKTKADSNATLYERLLSGTDTISIAGYSLIYDRRNSRYKPTRGFNFILNQDLAGLGGTSNYIKNKFQFNSYKRLSDRFIGAFKIEAGNINGYDDKYAPISSNYKLGGKRLRGFKYGKVGPKTGNSFTGGQYYYLTSLETNIDLNIDAFDISTTLFVDVGSVWGLENPSYSSIDDDHELRSSAGVNFNWDSAIGPINIIYANIIESETTDTTDSIYFDIGYNF